MSDNGRLASIRGVFMDVDGVLTDGTFSWSSSGEESKRFAFEDVMGLSIASKAGLTLGLISGEDSVLIDRFALKMGITNVAKGCKEKGVALEQFANASGLSLREIAYIGDDINDLPALAIAGLSVAPANAQPAIKSRVALVLERSGGHGAVRQLVDMIVAARVQTLL